VTSTVASLIVLIVRENLMSALAMERSAAEARANADFIVFILGTTVGVSFKKQGLSVFFLQDDLNFL